MVVSDSTRMKILGVSELRKSILEFRRTVPQEGKNTYNENTVLTCAGY